MITGNLWFRMPFEAYKLSTLKPAMTQRMLRDEGISDGIPLKACVNRGRWLIQCECDGAEYAFEEGLFMCQSCWNTNHQHKYRRFVFPKGREAIEWILMVSPLPNRNWLLGETLAQLKAENEAHTLELLGVS